MSENKNFEFSQKYKSGNSAQKILESRSENNVHVPEQKKSFVDSLSNKDKMSANVLNNSTKKAEAQLIYLVKGIDAGRNAWYYVLVERLKVQLFLKAMNDEIIHLEEYGRILYSAYGDEPPESITNKLKEEYGINQ